MAIRPRNFVLISILGLYAVSANVHTQDATSIGERSLGTKGSKPRRPGKLNKKMFLFNYKNEPVGNIINDVAAASKKNVVLPIGSDALKTEMTISYPERVSPDAAWDLLQTYLDVAGLTIAPHGTTFVVKKNEQNTLRQGYPIFIGIPPSELPDSDEKITYVYLLENIKLSPGAGGPTGQLKQLLEDLLVDSKKTSGRVLFDTATNAVIVTGKSYPIKVAMQVVSELDKTGFREVIEMIKLTHTDPDFVAKFLMEQLIAGGPESRLRQIGARPSQPQQTEHRFSKSTRIIPEPRTGSLIILGRAQTVDELKNFIYKYIDVPLESGESLIHIYPLQYLDAEQFASDLRNIIKGPEGQQAQSKGTVGKKEFKDVIIEAEKSGKVLALKGEAGETAGIAQGGNRLVIAASKNDWKQLEKLIKELDKPQPIVSLEVLVVDVTLENEKQLGSQVRNRKGFNDRFEQIQFQSAQLDMPVLEKPDPKTLTTNLLRLCTNPDGSVSNLASMTPAGSTVLTFEDLGGNGVWWVLQALRQYTNLKVLSHPHVVTNNNQAANISTAQERYVEGPSQTTNAVAEVKQEPIEAHLKIDILPRINKSNSINLQIIVDVQDFIDRQEDDNSRTMRQVVTNATIGNGEILVIGGLVRAVDSDNKRGTPLLDKLPVVGWLFKRRAKTDTKNNLLVFIAPTIVKPKIGGGMTELSKAKFDYAQEAVEQGELFDGLRDPITRWFFRPGPYDDEWMMESYRQRKFLVTQEIPQEPVPESAAQLEPVDSYREQDLKGKPPIELDEDESIEAIKRLAAEGDNPLDHL